METDEGESVMIKNLVSKDAVLQAFKNRLGDNYVTGIGGIKATLDEVPEATLYLFDEPVAKPVWVPVSERLPKDDDLHLVTLYDNSGDTPYIYVSVGWHIFGEDKWIVDNELHYNVTAWMENPEPYKGDK